MRDAAGFVILCVAVAIADTVSPFLVLGLLLVALVLALPWWRRST